MKGFQEGTLDTMILRLCDTISEFDKEWITKCIPATEEQIQRLEDIFKKYHHTIPTAYLYYLKAMGQNDNGLLEDEWVTKQLQ